jgi:hypothetical protein
MGASPNTGALGAQVTLRAGGVVQRRLVRTGSSYLSQSDTRLHFGLGDATRVDRLDVRWPDGTLQRREGLAVNTILTLTQHQAARLARR